MPIGTSLSQIYTTLTDFSGVSGDAQDYTPVTGAAIQWGGSNFLTFDAITERKHSGDTAVTEHPVEQGPDVTDHVRPQPYEIDITAFVSNTPVVGGTLQATSLDVAIYTPPISINPFNDLALAGNALSNALFGAPTYTAQIMQFATPFDAVADTLAQLQSFHDNSTLLTLITSECTYNFVVMTHYALGKTPEKGTGAEVEMTFKVLNVVQTGAAAAPTPSVVRGAVALNAGVQAPTPVPQKQSVLETLVDSFISPTPSIPVP